MRKMSPGGSYQTNVHIHFSSIFTYCWFNKIKIKFFSKKITSNTLPHPNTHTFRPVLSSPCPCFFKKHTHDRRCSTWHCLSLISNVFCFRFCRHGKADALTLWHLVIWYVIRSIHLLFWCADLFCLCMSAKLCQTFSAQIPGCVQIPVGLMTIFTNAQVCFDICLYNICAASGTVCADAGGVDFDNDDSVFPCFVVQILADPGA